MDLSRGLGDVYKRQTVLVVKSLSCQEISLKATSVQFIANLLRVLKRQTGSLSYLNSLNRF
jgi:hypothetical protein